MDIRDIIIEDEVGDKYYLNDVIFKINYFIKVLQGLDCYYYIQKIKRLGN